MDRLQYPPPVYSFPPSALGNMSGRQCKGWGDRGASPENQPSGNFDKNLSWGLEK
jgi:hypothetical protein